MHLFVDNLTNVDFSYLHPERGLVGETWLASIVLDGALDDQGMVCDFGTVKKTVRNWLDSTIDHSLVIPQHAKQLQFSAAGDQFNLEWQYSEQPSQPSGYTLSCSSPRQAITRIDSDLITPESVAAWCIRELKALLPQSIDRIRLTFTPETITHHFYHYSHGLKKHSGNCQRIAHGHRSTIEIYADDERQFELEKYWCEQWRDIYIGSQDDLIKSENRNGTDCYHFRYQAEQGDFALTLPQTHTYLINTDSTVEFIAQHIADQLKAEQPQHRYRVKAFEGIGKGAVAVS